MEHMQATLTKFATQSKDITPGSNILVPTAHMEAEVLDTESMEVLTTHTRLEK